MKKIFLILIPVLLAYVFWPESDPKLEFDEQDESEIVYEDTFEEEVVEEAAPEPTEIPQTKPREIIQTVKTINSDTSPIKGGRSLPPGVVEFELIKGNWAVTHGDILLGKLETKIDGTRGQFRPQKSVLWDTPDIPYGFSQGFSKERVQEIIQVMNDFSSSTVINFYPLDAANLPKDYLMFVPSEEICASYLGKTGGQQPIFLKKDCGRKEIMHEAMHALGFVHEQSRSDRDRFVKINWENIKEGYENQFDIAPDNYLDIYRGFVFTFDYQSVMLYSPQHFTKSSNLKTIESTTNKEIAPSQDGLSPVDIQRVNYLYGN